MLYQWKQPTLTKHQFCPAKKQQTCAVRFTQLTLGQPWSVEETRYYSFHHKLKLH